MRHVQYFTQNTPAGSESEEATLQDVRKAMHEELMEANTVHESPSSELRGGAAAALQPPPTPPMPLSHPDLLWAAKVSSMKPDGTPDMRHSANRG